MKEQPRFRDEIRTVVKAVEGALGRFFPAGEIRMGGGSVLEARWGHRRSTDVDLFCPQATYFAARRQHGSAMQQRLRDISSDPEEAMVDLRMIRAHVQGMEVTLMAEEPLIGERTREMVPGTAIETWSSADILAGKLLYRLSQSQLVEPRDLYDLAAAAHHDPAALRTVARALGQAHHEQIQTLLRTLPDDWEAGSRKSILGLPNDSFDYRPETVAALLSQFASASPGEVKEPLAEECGP